MLSEESAVSRSRSAPQWPQYWLVDPLDGTREFLARNGQFTVNIALIRGHAPALGVVHVPVSDASYLGLPGVGAWRQQGEGRAAPIRVAARSGDAGARGGQPLAPRRFADALPRASRTAPARPVSAAR